MSQGPLATIFLRVHLFKLKAAFYSGYCNTYKRTHTYVNEHTHTELDFYCMIAKGQKSGFSSEGLQFLECSIFLPKHIGNILCEAKDGIYLIFSLAFEVYNSWQGCVFLEKFPPFYP